MAQEIQVFNKCDSCGQSWNAVDRDLNKLTLVIQDATYGADLCDECINPPIEAFNKMAEEYDLRRITSTTKSRNPRKNPHKKGGTFECSCGRVFNSASAIGRHRYSNKDHSQVKPDPFEAEPTPAPQPTSV